MRHIAWLGAIVLPSWVGRGRRMLAWSAEAIHGEARPGECDPATEARAALFGDNVGQAASQGERAFISAAGASTADDSIREQIDYEAQGVVRRNEGFVDRMLAFGGSGAPAAEPLDPEQEQRRLDDEESIRRATGGGQITIRRERSGFRLPGT